MKMNYVVPNMDQTFGQMKFGGLNQEIMVGFGREQRLSGRSYDLFSPKQREVVVVLPARIPEKILEYKEKVKLVNPRIVFENNNGYVASVLHADDLVKA